MSGERPEKIDGNEIKIESDFLTKLENFWFYHKWKVIIIGFLLVIAIIWIVQTAMQNTADTTVILGGPYYSSVDVRGEMYEAFASVLPEDSDGDGEKEVEIVHFEIYSEEQLKALKAPDTNYGVNSSNYKDFNSTIQYGEYSVCIIDRWLYDDLKKAGAIRELSDIFGEEPENAIDKYGIDFKSTAFAKSFKCFETLPDSTVLCFRTKGLMSGVGNPSGNNDAYAVSEALFKAIVNYK